MEDDLPYPPRVKWKLVGKRVPFLTPWGATWSVKWGSKKKSPVYEKLFLTPFRRLVAPSGLKKGQKTDLGEKWRFFSFF